MNRTLKSEVLNSTFNVVDFYMDNNFINDDSSWIHKIDDDIVRNLS